MSVIGDDLVVSLFELVGLSVCVWNVVNLVVDIVNIYKVRYFVRRRKYVINCLIVYINFLLKFVF